MLKSSRYHYRASIQQKHQIHKLLDTVCSTTKEWDGKEYAKYSPGWSDIRVAQQLGVQVRSVEYIRKEVFGNLNIPLPPRPKPAPAPQRAPVFARPVQEAVTPPSNLAQQLTERVKRLEELNDELQKRLTQLEEVVTRPLPTHGGLNGSGNRHP